MAQLTGSGPGNGTNYAMVDNSLGTNDGRLWVDSTISGVPMVAISGGIHIGSVSANVDSVYIQSGANIQIDTIDSSYVTSGTISVDNLYAGSKNYQGTNPWEVVGSMIINSLPNMILNQVKVRGSGLVVFPKAHDRQIQGQTYLCGSYFYDIPSEGINSIFMAIGSCDLHSALDSRSDGDAVLELWENTHVTNSGNQITVINENRCAIGSTMNTKIWEGPTIGASGDIIHSAMFLGGSGLGNKFTSAPVATGLHGGELIFCAGSAYLIKLKNLAYRDITYDWNMEMHEHC